MKNETLKQLITQTKKYNLGDCFSGITEFKNWAEKLNDTQINNFLSLDIEFEKIEKIRKILINNDLLNCNDYKERVNAISKLKNGDGCWHLYEKLCNPNFLNSKNFYKDIEMIAKLPTSRYGLWMVDDNNFINSIYHYEDLNLLVNVSKEEAYIKSDALATVATNNNSINSPYHLADMKLIANSDCHCLQSSSSYPKRSINSLALNKVSLEDKYHLENMQILASNQNYGEILYEIMTNSNIVNGKNYRKEVEAIVKAKSEITAKALYYYIANPKLKFKDDCYNFGHNTYFNRAYINEEQCVAGNSDPDYLKNLVKISEFDDKYVMYYVSLLMNSDFLKSPYKEFDLELLKNITSENIFMDLYKLINDIDKIFLNSKHHKKDAVIISQTMNDEIRRLLIKKASNSCSIKSINHEKDMELITKIDLNKIETKIYYELHYYLFEPDGINDMGRYEKIEKLLNGNFVERNNNAYLDVLEKQLDGCNYPIVESKQVVGLNLKTKILSLFKKR